LKTKLSKIQLQYDKALNKIEDLKLDNKTIWRENAKLRDKVEFAKGAIVDLANSQINMFSDIKNNSKYPY